MNQNQYSTYPVADANVRVNAFIRGVYLWMAGALLISGLMCYIIGTNMSLLQIFVDIQREGRSLYIRPSVIWWACAIIELGLVFYFSARLNRLSAGTATVVYIVYSALAGATLAPVFLVYTQTSITSVFFICAGTFAVTSVFGFVTKKNLTGIGHFMFMGLIGIIIATLVNFVLKSTALHMAIGYIGVFVFVGLTAYDTQKMRNMALTMPDDVGASIIRKAMLSNALSLYLDFINLFLMLLRIFGSRN